MNQRAQMLQQWLKTLFPTATDMMPITNDASFRQYFRTYFNDGTTAIVMDAPPHLEKNKAFVTIAKAFRAAEIDAPEVIAENYQDGFFLLSDFGDITLQQVIQHENAENWYQCAFDNLLKIQKCDPNSDLNLPYFDNAFMYQQCLDTQNWFFAEHLNYTLSITETLLLKNTYDTWSHTIFTQPQTIIHRDYHCRNLMVLNYFPQPQLGILDFQDAMIGPMTHDIVSLLRDCYLCWPEDFILDCLQSYYLQLRASTALSAQISFTEFTRWFDFTGLQLHYRILGTFARLYHRDGKHGYLQDIPNVSNYILRVSDKYPELRDFREFLLQTLNPPFLLDPRLPATVENTENGAGMTEKYQ